MLETIIDDFAVSLDLPDRTRFYAVLVERLIERRNRVQQALDGSDPKPNPFEQLQ
jgi:hypothetical protein